ncbi:DUF2946 domain-containing protein [Paraburkholderia sp.]|uniref:DUF2946 domain-containing protein n=1 Tax=Paraburkholderia sp. TaxID=1926495 RepID=UPI003D6FB89A
MILDTRKHLTAWLGILAMCLIVFVPVISQLVMSARANEPVAAICSATQPDGGSQHAADPLAACGYCDLLCTHAAMPSVAPVVAPVLTLIVLAAVPLLSTRFTPLGAFPSGRPRDPPFAS